MEKTQVRSLGGEDPLEEEIATHSSTLAWRIPTDRGAWRATVHGLNHEPECNHLPINYQSFLLLFFFPQWKYPLLWKLCDCMRQRDAKLGDFYLRSYSEAVWTKESEARSPSPPCGMCPSTFSNCRTFHPGLRKSGKPPLWHTQENVIFSPHPCQAMFLRTLSTELIHPPHWHLLPAFRQSRREVAVDEGSRLLGDLHFGDERNRSESQEYDALSPRLWGIFN